MPGIKIRGPAAFTVGSGKLTECFGAIRHRPGAHSGFCCSATQRLPCALVFANKEDVCL